MFLICREATDRREIKNTDGTRGVHMKGVVSEQILERLAVAFLQACPYAICSSTTGACWYDGDEVGEV